MVEETNLVSVVSGSPFSDMSPSWDGSPSSGFGMQDVGRSHVGMNVAGGLFWDAGVVWKYLSGARKFHGRDLLQHIVWWRISSSNVFVFRFCTNYIVDGSEFLQQLRLVVYPIIYRVLAPSQVVQISSINSSLGYSIQLKKTGFFHISDGSCDSLWWWLWSNMEIRSYFPNFWGVKHQKHTFDTT